MLGDCYTYWMISNLFFYIASGLLYQKGKVEEIMIKAVGFKKTDVNKMIFSKSDIPKGKAKGR